MIKLPKGYRVSVSANPDGLFGYTVRGPGTHISTSPTSYDLRSQAHEAGNRAAWRIFNAQQEYDSGAVTGVIFAVSNDGGKTAVAWRKNVFDAFSYLELQNRGGLSDYAVVAVKATQEHIAREIAFKMHSGQTRHDGVTPYFSHPERVALAVKAAGGTDEEVALSYVHDVPEMTGMTARQLVEEGLSPRVADAAVRMGARDRDTTYMDQIHDLASDPLTRRVKIFDINDNLSDKPSDTMRVRYQKALEILEVADSVQKAE